ncbi:glycosyltransferase [Sphingomonas sp. 10B4]|uniref:glycosyltransferase n=1 Tax=Sphingomonas sp. 10B4 TaxID=3048575 RepID=UPI002AB4EFF7|nr:glycosyltransferase [Sphingomonas sp. 10B4]MDY7523908.1 glycosyltransferase [Sphingomonas sp. 10B4]MEB0284515.1 glycosyltransferase [Sphingomonas sp. 10B4]
MKILHLTNYPLANPIHGGQIRCANIAGELRAAGHVVQSLAVYVESHYVPDSALDIPFGVTSEFWDYDLPYLTDYLTGLYAERDPQAYAKLEAVVDDFAPNVIISEHPWLMPAAKKLASTRPGIRIVYSSHNVEFRLKEAILLRGTLRAELRDKLVQDIRELEYYAVVDADLVVACTDSDALYYRTLSEDTIVVVGGNGVEPFSCPRSRVDQWRNFIGRPFPLFVSSAHPPNANGFWDMMMPGLTFLRPKERLVIAGSVCEIILDMQGVRKYENFNRSRLDLLGRMNKTDLQALVSASHVMMLPITSGEGSNLKTAEALESGSAIVGTTMAFRGFEDAMSLPHVHIADDPTLFRRKVRELLDAPRFLGGTPPEVRKRYHWSALLSDIVNEIGKWERA